MSKKIILGCKVMTRTVSTGTFIYLSKHTSSRSIKVWKHTGRHAVCMHHAHIKLTLAPPAHAEPCHCKAKFPTPHLQIADIKIWCRSRGGAHIWLPSGHLASNTCCTRQHTHASLKRTRHPILAAHGNTHMPHFSAHGIQYLLHTATHTCLI